MNPRVLRRFIILLAILIVVTVVGTQGYESFISREPGDYQTEKGAHRLEDGLLDKALRHFDKALEQSPNHRGAMMGRALVFIVQERYPPALEELNALIAFLDRTLVPDDTTGRGVLAAAYANRGIVHDRSGDYEQALESYILSLQTDSETVEGPSVVHKILYGGDDVSTVRDRAQYLYEQLQLPVEERLMRVPELDLKQRMHRP